MATRRTLGCFCGNCTVRRDGHCNCQGSCSCGWSCCGRCDWVRAERVREMLLTDMLQHRHGLNHDLAKLGANLVVRADAMKDDVSLQRSANTYRAKLGLKVITTA